MELDHALQTLEMIKPGGVGQVVGIRRNPRAMGSMGLAPFEVEASTADDARSALTKYLEQYPRQEREQIRRELMKDYHDIQRIKEAGVDLSFLDEEFGKVPKLSEADYESEIERLRENILFDETHESLFFGGPNNEYEQREDERWRKNKERNLEPNKKMLAKLEEEYGHFYPKK